MRLLLDEHVEHEVRRRLTEFGHDIVHVDTHPSLEKGASDRLLARFSLTEERVVVTSDDDFVSIPESAYHCVFLFEDEALSSKQVTKTVHNVSQAYPAAELTGLQKVGREWL